MRSKSFWLSVAAALALAAPMAAARANRDPGSSEPQQEPDPMAGRLTADQTATSVPQAPTTVETSVSQAEPEPSAAGRSVTDTESQASAPAQEPAQVQQEETAPAPIAPAASASTAPAPAELPKTASPLALLTLLGLGSAGSATGVRFLRRR